MNRRESADLDRHITGNWGEDSVGNASIRRQHGGHQPNCHGRSDPQACICTFDHGEVEAVHNHGSEEGPGLGCKETRVGGRLVGECMNATKSPMTTATQESRNVTTKTVFSPYGSATELEDEAERIMELHRLPKEVVDLVHDAIQTVRCLEQKLKPKPAPKYSEARCVSDVLTLMRRGGAL